MAWISVGETENRSSVSKVLTPEEIQEIIKLTDSKFGDLICIVSGKSNTVYTVLGALRCELAKKLEESRAAGAKKVLEKNAAVCEKYNKA